MRVFGLLAALGFLFIAVPASAQPDPYLDFARRLFEEGDPYRAVTEAKRFLFLHPDSPRGPEARLLIGRASCELGEYTAAAEAFEAVMGGDENPGLAAQAALAWGKCLEKKDPAGAAAEYYRFLAEDVALPPETEPEVRNRAQYRLGWMLMEGGRFDEAKAAFGRVDPEHELGYSAQAVVEEIPDEDDVSWRSPRAAGAMSAALPGLGQLYTGRPVDAGLAFGFNAAFAYGAYAAYEDENWPVFGLLGLFELAFYGGNIYNAVNGAHIHNRESRSEALDGIKKRHGWTLGYVPSAEGLAFSWYTDF